MIVKHTIRTHMGVTSNSHFGHSLSQTRGREFRVATVGSHSEGLYLQWNAAFEREYCKQKFAFLYSPSVALKRALGELYATGDCAPLIEQVLKTTGWVDNGPIRPFESQAPTSRTDLSEFCTLLWELSECVRFAEGETNQPPTKGSVCT